MNSLSNSKEQVMTENASELRMLAELLHDAFVPVEGERFPQRGHDVVRLLDMSPIERELFLCDLARRALGLPGTFEMGTVVPN